MTNRFAVKPAVRYVVVHGKADEPDAAGIFLGIGIGLGFFSNLDAAGQTHAPTCNDSYAAMEMIQELGCDMGDKHRLREVAVICTGVGPDATIFASPYDLDRAGLSWATESMHIEYEDQMTYAENLARYLDEDETLNLALVMEDDHPEAYGLERICDKEQIDGKRWLNRGPVTLLSRAFHFDSTPQGFDYWDRVRARYHGVPAKALREKPVSTEGGDSTNLTP